ncbi:MAG: hypothetical protein ACXW4L_03090 [Candidatus Limnocylindrales bacterium]
MLVVLTVIAGAACGSGPPSAAVRSAATSYGEYADATCAAWDALFRAVGNPDTASGSDLSRSLDQAVASGDAASAERVAADIARELRVGREQVAIAGGWQPRAPVMVQLDRVFAAYEAMITAKLALARHEPNAVDPQSAFEQAGGVEAYFAWIEALRATGAGAAGATAKQCPNVPVTP